MELCPLRLVIATAMKEPCWNLLQIKLLLNNSSFTSNTYIPLDLLRESQQVHTSSWATLRQWLHMKGQSSIRAAPFRPDSELLWWVLFALMDFTLAGQGFPTTVLQSETLRSIFFSLPFFTGVSMPLVWRLPLLLQHPPTLPSQNFSPIKPLYI